MGTKENKENKENKESLVKERYHTDYVKDEGYSLEKLLNKRANEGWTLHSVVPIRDMLSFYLVVFEDTAYGLEIDYQPEKD